MFLSWMKTRASRICLRNPCTSSSKGTISSSKTFWKSPPGALQKKNWSMKLWFNEFFRVRVLIWDKVAHASGFALKTMRKKMVKSAAGFTDIFLRKFSKGTISSSKTFWKSPPGALQNKNWSMKLWFNEFCRARFLIWAKSVEGFQNLPEKSLYLLLKRHHILV